MTKIKDASIIILIVFIIASILYGIHMFRYEYIDNSYVSSISNLDRKTIIFRVDRITHDTCILVYHQTDWATLHSKGEEIQGCHFDEE